MINSVSLSQVRGYSAKLNSNYPVQPKHTKSDVNFCKKTDSVEKFARRWYVKRAVIPTILVNAVAYYFDAPLYKYVCLNVLTLFIAPAIAWTLINKFKGKNKLN